MSWKIGDLVQLKSGGPVMTVSATEQSGFVACMWFPTVESELPSAKGFPPGALMASQE